MSLHGDPQTEAYWATREYTALRHRWAQCSSSLLHCFLLNTLQILISRSVFQRKWPIIVCSVPISALARLCLMVSLFIGDSVISTTFLDRHAKMPLALWPLGLLKNKEFFIPWIFKIPASSSLYMCCQSTHNTGTAWFFFLSFKKLRENWWPQTRQISKRLGER